MRRPPSFRRSKLAALPLLALAARPALADTISVDAAGGADSSSIQGGIDLATGGDTVQVAAGKYGENIDFLGKNIAVIGAGANSTFLVGTGAGPVVRIDSG